MVAPYFPPAGEAWEAVQPEAVGWDSNALADALSFAAERDASAVVVLHNGRILAEGYWQGADPASVDHIASGQKSIVSFLLGVAIAEGRLAIDDAVSRHLGQGWTNCPPEQEARITLRHLISMTSGLDEKLAFEAVPGTRWRYNDVAYFRAKAALEAAVDESIEAYSSRHLWAPLGMQQACWRTLSFTIEPDGRPIEGVYASARDLARFGLMMQAGGAWAGGALPIDAAYLAASLESSQSINPAYGYLWWLNGKATFVTPGPYLEPQPGPIIPDAPADLFAALGSNDKKVYVCPSRGLVVTRLGGLAARPGASLFDFDTELWRRILAAAPALG